MNTRKLRKMILTLCSALLLVSLSVGATLAYLTFETDVVKNTFTVGNVKIKLDEAEIDKDGKPTGKRIEASEEEPGNEYHLLPNSTYEKDPTVTVLANSEACYVRAYVTISYAQQIEAIAQKYNKKVEDFVGGITEDWMWEQKNVTVDAAANTMTYEVWYKYEVPKAATNTKLQAIFTQIIVPEELTNDDLATLVTVDDEGNVTDKMTITVSSQAIQSNGFVASEGKTPMENAWASWPTDAGNE